MSEMKIVRSEAYLCDLEVETVRTDAIQSFTKQETLFATITTAAGLSGIGYSYTIGTGGRAVLELLRNDILPLLQGLDARHVEALWQRLFFATHAHSVGPMVNLALAAVDCALWDLRCKEASQPLWMMAGGAQPEGVPLYDTEGGWLHLTTDELVEQAKHSIAKGWRGVKIKIGKPSASEDAERLQAVRAALGPQPNIMVDANQAFSSAEAKRRARLLEDVDIFWFEEPLPAEDVAGHALLARSTSIPIAVGESIYSLSHFREYLQVGAAGIVQPDVARIGGITQWLKVAHLAEAFNTKLAPHFLMELHASLCAAVPNAIYVEHIPQLRAITKTEVQIKDGRALPPSEPGLGIVWDDDQIGRRRVA